MNFDKKIFFQGETLFPRNQFGKALGEAKGEVMAVAIQTSKQAMFRERRAWAQMLLDMGDMAESVDVATALREASNHMVNRIPVQNQ